MLCLAGCVTTQTIQPATKDNKIVIVSAVGNVATYKLVATTVLQNSENKFQLSGFNADRGIASEAKHELQRLGYKNVTIVDVPAGSAPTQGYPFDAGWSTVSLKANVAQSIKSMIANQHADYVLFFSRGGACPPIGPCEVTGVYGFGVSKRSILGIQQSYAYAALSMAILDAKTLERIDNEDDSDFDNSHSAQLSDDANFYNNDISYVNNWIATSYGKQAVKLIGKSKMLSQSATYRKFHF